VSLVSEVSEVEGVDHVAAMVSLLVSDPDPDNAEMNFGNPPTIYAADNQSDFKNRNWETMGMREGKMLDRNSKDDEVTVGINIATDKKLHVGNILTFVVAILRLLVLPKNYDWS